MLVTVSKKSHKLFKYSQQQPERHWALDPIEKEISRRKFKDNVQIEGINKIKQNCDSEVHHCSNNRIIC